MIDIHILKVYVFFAFQGMKISKKVYNFDTFFDWTLSFCLNEKHISSNINQNCIWLMFDIKRQIELYFVDV